LSYTSFEYSSLNVEVLSNTFVRVCFNVKNTGKVAGKESVLLFSSDHFASCVPDNRRLRDFTKVSLAPGESATVTFELPATDLAFADSKGQWTLEEGDFTLSVGGQNVNVRCTETILWDQPNID
jgi:beta-glucosidase